jgi:hypothetical protein
MTAILKRRPDIGHHIIERLGLQQPIVELIYLSFFGTVAGLVAGGGFSSKPIENLVNLLLVFGVFIPRLIISGRFIRPIFAEPPPFQFYFVMQALLMPMRFFQGLLYGAPPVYLVTDFLLALVSILIYVVSRAYYERILPIDDGRVFRILIPTVFIVVFLGSLPIIAARPSVVVSVMGASLVLLMATTRRPFWQTIAGAVILLLSITSVPRGFLIGVGVVTLLIAVSNIFWRTIFLGLGSALVLAASVLLNYQSIPNLPPRVVALGQLLHAAENLHWENLTFSEVVALGSVSASIHQRVWEAQLSVDALSKRGPFAWAFGLGYGTSLDMSNAPDATVRNEARATGLAGGGLVHNIHLIVFEQLLRFGLIGLALFLWLGARMFQVYWRCRRGVMRSRHITFDFLCILTLIGCYMYYQFASDWDIAFIAFGMLGYLDARFERVYRTEKQHVSEFVFLPSGAHRRRWVDAPKLLARSRFRSE